VGCGAFALSRCGGLAVGRNKLAQFRQKLRQASSFLPLPEQRKLVPAYGLFRPTVCSDPQRLFRPTALVPAYMAHSYSTACNRSNRRSTSAVVSASISHV